MKAEEFLKQEYKELYRLLEGNKTGYDFMDHYAEQQIEELKEKNKEWKNYTETKVRLYKEIKELKEYVQHKEGCEYSPPYLTNQECTCGLDKLLNKH